MKDCSTCFYNRNFPEDTRHLNETEKCACLTKVPDNPAKCSFYIPKDKYEWGVNKFGAPCPVKRKGAAV